MFISHFINGHLNGRAAYCGVLYQLCVQLEGGLEADKHREEGRTEKRKHRKGLKGLVERIVRGNKKYRDME